MRFFLTTYKNVVTSSDLKKALEITLIVPDYVLNDFDIYIDDLIKEKYVNVKPLSVKQAYDYALNNEQIAMAIRAYQKMKEEKTGKYFSLVDAKEHVYKIIDKKRSN